MYIYFSVWVFFHEHWWFIGDQVEEKGSPSEAATRGVLQKEMLLNLQENTCVGVVFKIKLQASKKETPTQVFSCKFCEIFKNTYFI